MLLVNGKLLDEFGDNHASARRSIAAWKKGVNEADWKKKQDILLTFPRAKLIKNNRARFEIHHNKYRLIAEVSYDEEFVDLKFIGTHSEYDRIDPSTI